LRCITYFEGYKGQECCKREREREREREKETNEDFMNEWILNE